MMPDWTVNGSSMNAMTRDPVFCSCPPHWFGTVPSPCPVHNPGTFTVTTTNTATPLRTLTDADVEAIARRVAELTRKP